MNRKTNTRITIALSSVLALIAAVGTTSPVFAHKDIYGIGYSQGQTKASDDYNAYAQDYRPFCPVYDDWTAAHGPHTSTFCAGFIDGYNAQWSSLGGDSRAKVSTSQDSNVNIKGNNNRVVVNQQVNNGNSGSGSSPR